MIFFDYDGVLGDTEEGLFDEYKALKQKNENADIIEYLVNMDWHYWLRRAGPKRDAFDVLKAYDPKQAPILTRAWSTKEGAEKIIYIRENGVKNPIIIVPNDIRKSLVVNPKGNLLVEDKPENAKDWIDHGGEALLLDVGPYEKCKTIYSIEEAFIYAKEFGFI